MTTPPAQLGDARPAPSALECPRCGHQLGVMADQAEARGETHGKCGECGLDIEWRRLRVAALAPPWFVEARVSRRNIVRRAFGTLLRTARPFRFWRAIDLALPISARGLVVFITLLCVIAHLACAAQRFLTDSPRSAMPPLPRTVASAPAIGKAALALVWPYDDIDGAEIVVMAQNTSGTTELVPLLGDSVVLAADAIWMRGGDSPKPAAIAGYPPDWFAGVRWLRRGIGINESDPLLPPGIAAPLIVAMAVAGLTPLVMLLLPVSLRKARVRPRHFVRILALGLVLPAIILLGTMAATRVSRELGYLGLSDAHNHLYLLGELRDPFFTLLPLLLAATLGATWTAAAASRYLRLPNGRAVGVTCGAVSALTAAVALFLV